MKTEKNILIAFLLNLSFAIFECIGGIFTGSVAIISDSVHDIGDAASIGISYVLEKKSSKAPDNTHTYGYIRYSVIGSAITTFILLAGSVAVIFNSVHRIRFPSEIDYNGMILFAVIGVVVNFAAALFTHGGGSLNQKAVNLHMLEDVLGWVVVLIGAVVMRFTDFSLLDPLMSIGVAVFILLNTFRNLITILDLILEKTPHGVSVEEIQSHLLHLNGVLDVHHIHVWSLDGQSVYATMHIVTDRDAHEVKRAVRDELSEHGIRHVTLEIETPEEVCDDTHCHPEFHPSGGHHHHHHS